MDRYRDALRAGTVCESCRAANPPGSRFCGQCGLELG
ncbi:MAG: zinc-ribbon domain-containing protein [Gemmatimonadota bacterium]